MFRLIVVISFLAVSSGLSKVPLRRLAPIFPSGKIVGGVNTDIKDVPYQVAIEYGGWQFCAGSIISENYILSAGHCIETIAPNLMTVRYGATAHEDGGTLIKVKSYIGHDKYDEYTIDYDVSVIELSTPIEFSDTAQPIKLTDEEPSAGTKVTIAGWGRIGENENPPNTLQSVIVPIVDRKTCESEYEDDNTITPRMICAGTAGHASCQGDSGGAVVFNGTVVGIVSWALGCAREGYPGVYTNVADPEIRDFIRQNTNI